MTSVKFSTYKELSPGAHDATIVQAALEEGQYGAQIALTFMIENSETLETITLKAWVKPQISARFPFFAHLLEVAGVAQSESGTFDTDVLIDKKCVAILDNVTNKQGKTYLNVVDVKKK